MFDELPIVPLGQFLNSSVDLFGAALRAVMGQPALAFFAAAALFLAVLGLAVALFHQVKGRR